MWGFATNAISSIGLRKNLIFPSQASAECSDDDACSNCSREEGLECPICCESFNIVENIPYVLWCGHTLCKNSSFYGWSRAWMVIGLGLDPPLVGKVNIFCTKIEVHPWEMLLAIVTTGGPHFLVLLDRQVRTVAMVATMLIGIIFPFTDLWISLFISHPSSHWWSYFFWSSSLLCLEVQSSWPSTFCSLFFLQSCLSWYCTSHTLLYRGWWEK